MAHASENTVGTGLASAASEKFSNIRRAVTRYREYRRTLNALNDLDDRILNDLGLNRSDLSRAARNAIR